MYLMVLIYLAKIAEFSPLLVQIVVYPFSSSDFVDRMHNILVLIQIDAPYIPSVLLNLKTMPNAMEYILQSVQVCLHSWPTVQMPQNNRPSNQPVARHIVFADDGASNRATYWNNY